MRVLRSSLVLGAALALIIHADGWLALDGG
jgi:hypothetical protein